MKLTYPCICTNIENPPDELFAEYRIKPGHIGTRFGDLHVDAKLNGQHVDHWFEALAGPNGWVARFPCNKEGILQVCPNSWVIGEGYTRACIEILYGNVVLEYT